MDPDILLVQRSWPESGHRQTIGDKKATTPRHIISCYPISWCVAPLISLTLDPLPPHYHIPFVSNVRTKLLFMFYWIRVRTNTMGCLGVCATKNRVVFCSSIVHPASIIVTRDHNKFGFQIYPNNLRCHPMLVQFIFWNLFSSLCQICGSCPVIEIVYVTRDYVGSNHAIFTVVWDTQYQIVFIISVFIQQIPILYPGEFLAFRYCRCLCLCVCPCVNHEIVCTITLDPFKLGSPNLDLRCKTPYLRSLLSTLTFKVKFNFKFKFDPILSLKFVFEITHHPFKLGSSNIGQRCKTIWWRSLFFFFY